MRICSVAILALVIAGCAPKVEIEHDVSVTKDSTGQVSKIETKDGTTTLSNDGKDTKYEGTQGTVESKNGVVTATDKKGNTASFNAAIAEADLGGTPFYPGSTEKPGGLKSDANGKKTAMSQRETPDDPAKVLEFYKGKLGKPESESSAGTVAIGKWKKDKQEIDVSATKEGANTNVTIIFQGQ